LVSKIWIYKSLYIRSLKKILSLFIVSSGFNLWAVRIQAQPTELNFDQKFLFGIASAPGHAEDQLDDIWKDWAQAGKIKAFSNADQPLERLQFWSHPEIELDLAEKTGIQIYRMGVDWGRIQPAPDQFDEQAIRHYHEIFNEVKKRKMKLMLTLMHHSVPKWAQSNHGWKNSELKHHFKFFAERMIKEFHSDIDYWITFNEANIFVSLAYAVGLWPPGDQDVPWGLLSFGPLKGSAVKAMDVMAEAHNEVYDWAHKQYPQIKIGIAHNLAYYTTKSFIGRVGVWFMNAMMNWYFPHRIENHMDFFGFNYYGAEWINGVLTDVNDPDEEYSEAGRAIYPEGLRYFLRKISQDYPGLPIFITENGIADSTDILRPSYLVEHLKVVQEESSKGVPVIGYIFWTLSDNLEWADGYCPKFGLVEVDRRNGLKRTPRPSYYLYSDIVKNKKITMAQTASARDLVIQSKGKARPFCRSQDGVTPLDQPVYRPIR
jgi:beta-glucosidase/6-phospho-beta-glucosidase/beta-galactosidase